MYFFKRVEEYCPSFSLFQFPHFIKLLQRFTHIGSNYKRCFKADYNLILIL
jgi:hypothetical protein